MKGIRQRDTAPEMRIRQLLHRAGIRFRACPSDLPGRPDIANKTRYWAVFVHGCFWHGHRGCHLASVPKSNTAFWEGKLAANRARDQRKVQELRKLGYKVATVWQCELDNPTLLARLLRTCAPIRTKRRS